MKVSKHIGIKVLDEIHYKLKYISVKSKKTITEMLIPLIEKLISDYEEENGKID